MFLAKDKHQPASWILLISLQMEGSLHCFDACVTYSISADVTGESGHAISRISVSGGNLLSCLCEYRFPGLKWLIISAWKCHMPLQLYHPCRHVSHGCFSPFLKFVPWCRAGVAFNSCESVCLVSHTCLNLLMSEDTSEAGLSGFLLMFVQNEAMVNCSYFLIGQYLCS